jgi:hypothetical protein
VGEATSVNSGSSENDRKLEGEFATERVADRLSDHEWRIAFATERLTGHVLRTTVREHRHAECASSLSGISDEARERRRR